MNFKTISPISKRLFVQRTCLGICLALALAHTACSPNLLALESGTASSTPFASLETAIGDRPAYVDPSSTSQPIVSPTGTPIVANTPSATPIPLYTVVPLVTPVSSGNSPFFDNWSPDSTWIALWLVEYGGDTLPGSLAFVEADSGKICLHPEVFTENVGDGRVRWQDNSNVIVVTNALERETFIGSPCTTFLPSEPLPEPMPGELSPDGRYLASTISGEQGPGLIPFTTTVTDLNTAQIIANVSWEFGRSDAEGGGPGWLNNHTYLIGPDPNRGFLYLSIPDGMVGNVVTDLLGLDVAYVAQYRSVFSLVDTVTGAYHLLLKWEGGPSPLPLLLYHSETDEIETLPFYSPWAFNSPGIPGFSLDNQWLLLGDPVGDEPFLEKIGGDYWLRPVDPPASEAMQIPEGMFPGGLSLKAQKIAFFDGNGIVYIISFPDGKVLSQWSAPGYSSLEPVAWSSDGSRLVTLGHQSGSNQTALFVIEP